MYQLYLNFKCKKENPLYKKLILIVKEKKVKKKKAKEIKIKEELLKIKSADPVQKKSKKGGKILIENYIKADIIIKHNITKIFDLKQFFTAVQPFTPVIEPKIKKKINIIYKYI